MKTFHVTILICLLSLTAGVSSDWPRFLGPTGDAVSTETGLQTKWPVKGPPELWAKRVGTGYSAPSVRDGRVVVHHREKNAEIVEALDPKTGESLWRYAYPSHYTDPFGYNNGPRCTPLLTEKYCYTFGAEGKLICLNVTNGTLVWQRDTEADFTIPQAFFGVGSTPLLEGNRLLVMVGGQPNSGMVAFDATTGKTLWESVGEKNWNGVPKIGWPGQAPVRWQPSWKQASYATPVAADFHGKRHVLCFTRQGLVSVDPADGAVNFTFWFRSRLNDSVNAMNPIVLGDQILISGAYYGVGAVLLKVNPDGKGVTEQWRSRVLEMHWMTPILHEGYLYAFSGRNEPDANFRCVEMKSGKLMWERNERWAKYSSKQPTVYGRGSAIMADGHLIVLGEGGLLGTFKVNPNKPEEISRFQVPQLEYPCWAAPVLAHKRLYLRSEKYLVCFDLTPKS